MEGGGSIHLATRVLRCTAVQYVAGGCDQLRCPVAPAAPTAGQPPGLSARHISVRTTRPPSVRQRGPPRRSTGRPRATRPNPVAPPVWRWLSALVSAPRKRTSRPCGL